MLLKTRKPKRGEGRHKSHAKLGQFFAVNNPSYETMISIIGPAILHVVHTGEGATWVSGSRRKGTNKPDPPAVRYFGPLHARYPMWLQLDVTDSLSEERGGKVIGRNQETGSVNHETTEKPTKVILADETYEKMLSAVLPISLALVSPRLRA
ncbi:hypothetical protein P175DRAFT_0532374 [Aspergillus ochraceoroseus IBT 24754]|uniref:Uncharacterized protein n=1 Tax=Aspergillus ochraceoroseus IBT 24754 TaxID=1392256 RepID=A0A2T5LXI5_9EURO|nr:uncharacterized protein P175DRAFT_0532374 [Aspergillus ochraceoroseus IBT 24754]PTU21002.1 hypothetical protein P175DRAFT_0532374 [Aspergillus ochraceoroseus IBT 24754]